MGASTLSIQSAGVALKVHGTLRRDVVLTWMCDDKE